MLDEKPLWVPSAERIAAAQIWDFMAQANRRHGTHLTNYRELHTWSTAYPELFWSLTWDYCGVIGDKGKRLVADRDKMPGARFLPDATLNFAENLLRCYDASDALVFRGEDKVHGRLTWAELNALVSRLQQAMQAAGIGVGDRVAAMLPNCPEAIALMLATASIGAIWSSCSPDLGSAAYLTGLVRSSRSCSSRPMVITTTVRKSF